ncbi:hypothetical protein H0A61_01384 [Koleobacter methoxysyntrophicus]|uniref:Uncharacterized protein n=1 Tax=Koleobacter methoxysyntrophicus TaxID=2751313 RepID=A0A8A0RNL5_9FIRM|nr:hypothetical protein [Koleobacter methoxysyntrophicus]QSQ09027.1 hypothetical protein H0A61_01384 [Koleobacter methoxysyntrophicus]
MAERDIMIDPSLQGQTFVVQIFYYNELIRDFVYELKDELQKMGSIVMVVDQHKINPDIFKILKAKIILAFIGTQIQHTADISFYYSLSRKEKSLELIANILKQITLSNINITFEVLGKWQQLLKFNYLKLLNETGIPSILIEIRNPEIVTTLKEKTKTWIINSLLEMFGEFITENIQPLKNSIEELQVKEIEAEGEVEPLLLTDSYFEENPPPEAVDSNTTEHISSQQEDTSTLDDPESISLLTDRPMEKYEEISHPPHKRKTLQASTAAEQENKPSHYSPRQKTPQKRRGKIFNPLNPPYDGPIYTFGSFSQSNEMHSSHIFIPKKAVCSGKNIIRKISSQEKRVFIASKKNNKS